MSKNQTALVDELHMMPEYPRFTKEMTATHTILVPQMAPILFGIINEIFRQEGYTVEFLENGGPEVAQEGLKYVHNDTCYPALLVIGQFIDALKSGKYDLNRTALLITQTGGGCRASNYIHLLRKALVKAGFPQVPVASLNFSGLERDSGFRITLNIAKKAIPAMYYGDELMALVNQVRPYEDNPGEADALVQYWIQRISDELAIGRGIKKKEMIANFDKIAASFAAIPVTRVPKVKVGIVGEIYVKFSPLGNSHLEEFLANEGCEVVMPGLLGFVQYCIVNGAETIRLYGGNPLYKKIFELVERFFDGREKAMYDIIEKHGLRAPGLFKDTQTLGETIISKGAKMGEGWLLASEMIELVQSGCPNIVCAQPFGCLPNHVVGKGMIGKIRAIYPETNITPIDYDPSATQVNQENRIKLMIAVAKERLAGSAPTIKVMPSLAPAARARLKVSG